MIVTAVKRANKEIVTATKNVNKGDVIRVIAPATKEANLGAVRGVIEVC